MFDHGSAGFSGDPFKESPVLEENRKLKCYVRELEHDLFYLHVFLAAQDESEDACAFLQDHEEDPVPFRTWF